MAGSRTLKLNILAETKNLTDGLNKANSQVEGASGSLNRLIVELAIATQIPMRYWETAEDILTALEILKERNG